MLGFINKILKILFFALIVWLIVRIFLFRVVTANGLNAGIRYRYVGDRPANVNNTVTAKGYNVLNAVINYTRPKYTLGITMENLANVEWNEAQFDTESKLKNESQPVSELHYTPGTPFLLKEVLRFSFNLIRRLY